MGNHHAPRKLRLPAFCCGPHIVHHRLTGKPMKAISTDSMTAIVDGDRVGGSLRRHGLVEDGVEAGVMPGLWKSPHHVPNQGDGLRIVQRGKHHRLFEILQYFIGDSLVPVEQRPGVHHPVANRVERRHSRLADCVFQELHGVGLGIIPLGAVRQLPPIGVAKRKPKFGSAHTADFAVEQRDGPAAGFAPEPSPASKMENLIEDEPLLMTSTCTLTCQPPRYTLIYWADEFHSHSWGRCRRHWGSLAQCALAAQCPGSLTTL